MFIVISSPARNVLSHAGFVTESEAETYARELESDGVLVTSIRER